VFPLGVASVPKTQSSKAQLFMAAGPQTS